MLRSWDEGYFPTKKKTGELDFPGNFPQKITLGWACSCWWILGSVLRPERIKKDRGKMEDKVWGEDCFAHNRVDAALACFFLMSFFFPVGQRLKGKGKQD